MARPDSLQQPLPPLLRLTPTIRRRIYRYVGLASWDGRPASCSSPVPSSFRGLLLSCRDIHGEAAALLYSANRFILHYTHPGSLEPLRALTAPSLAALASIKILFLTRPPATTRPRTTALRSAASKVAKRTVVMASLTVNSITVVCIASRCLASLPAPSVMTICWPQPKPC